MKGSILEITEREYCIKLNKDVFDLSLVHQLIKRIQAEEFFFRRSPENEEEGDVLSRRAYREEREGFDYLEDK
ncbi:hypothetical protein C7T94_15170 [Pedobacter yulinensis]|uniref:Uncharacterized protein n=1 Tax=Pedobacter yulinensis TaxID=2126353 RepID=A0A2T3HI79_9SPHI|nr:hypothetical protein [Pedobacter yulinensis]PST82142.1 hypothetical protein C7T94_15170 [Pedobacter yulinensis]